MSRPAAPKAHGTSAREGEGHAFSTAAMRRCAVAALAVAALAAGCAQPQRGGGAAPPFPTVKPAAPAATAAPAPAPAPAPMPNAAGCDANAARAVVGQAYSDTLADRARQAAGAQTVRMVRAGQATTREFVASRLTLELDAMGNVVRASCG